MADYGDGLYGAGLYGVGDDGSGGGGGGGGGGGSGGGASLGAISFICEFSTADPTGTQSWHDISPYVISFNISRGKQRALDRFEAGTMSISLKNTDRRFDPTYAQGPYYGGLYPLRKIRFGAVLNNVTTWLFTGYVDHWPQMWNGPNWAQVDLTCVDGFEFFSNAEFASVYSTFTTDFSDVNANITFTATQLGWIGNQIGVAFVGDRGLTEDPDDPEDPVRLRHKLKVEVLDHRTPNIDVSQLVVLIHIETRNGDPFTTASEVIEAVNNHPDSNSLVLASLAPGSDGTGIITQFNSTPIPNYLTGAGFDSELSGARIGEIADAVDWPAGDRVIATGTKICEAQTITPDSGTKALDQFYNSEITEQGALFMDTQGRLTFLDQTTLATSVYANSVLTMVDAGPQSTELAYQALSGDWDRDLIYNDVRVTRENGNEQVATDSTSISRYFKRTYTTSTLNESDNEALGLAQTLLQKFKDPRFRFEPVQLRPGTNLTAWTSLVALDLMQLVTVKRTPPGGGQPIVVQGSLIGINISGGPGPMTSCVWGLNVDPQAVTARGFIFNDSTYGVFNTGVLIY